MRPGAAFLAPVAAYLSIGVAPAWGLPPAAQSAALWRVVHDLCVVDYRATGLPAPCLAVDLAGRYAVLKDLKGRTQLLLIPTDRVGGIESPVLLAPSAPNYFALAWRTRDLFARLAGRAVPRDDIALAINSVTGRSQNQFHIHIDCVRPDVRAALAAAEPGLGARWSPEDLTLAGRRYRALRLNGADLAANPFKLLAALPSARADMGAETLVVVGATFAGGAPGFIVLAHRADAGRGDLGAAEELMDHGCAVLAPPAAAPFSPAARP